jgi:hypothetical protein
MPRRNSKGRFVKSGRKRKSSTRRRRSAGTVSLAVRETVSLSSPRRRAPAVRYVRAPARRRRRSGGGVLGGAGLKGIVPSVRSKLPLMAGSAAYGFITQGSSATATKVKSYLDMVPTIAAIGKPATHGLVLTALACFTSGRIRRYSDLLATAALQQFAHNVGAADFQFAKAATMAGDDDLSGSIGEDDIRGYEDD